MTQATEISKAVNTSTLVLRTRLTVPYTYRLETSATYGPILPYDLYMSPVSANLKTDEVLDDD